jgi:hypothetical protein
MRYQSLPPPHIDEVAGELVLGLVSGTERSVALAHVLSCARCRALVEELSRSVDSLLLLAPRAEPPEGFESRVLDVLPPTAARRGPRFAAVGAVAAAVALLLGIAALVGRGDAAVPDTVAASMYSAEGWNVGQAFVHDGEPSWVFIAVPAWSDVPHEDDAPGYVLRLAMRDGSKETIGDVVLDPGNGAWGAAVDLDVARIARVELVDADGTVWCSASMSGARAA